MVSDARYRTKVWLDTYITDANITKNDDDTEALKIVVYGTADYPVTRVFKSPKNMYVVFAVGKPETTPLVGHDKTITHYRENVPITIYTVDKTDASGTQTLWKAEAELRRVAESYPEGSLRILKHMRDSTLKVGGDIMYSSEYLLTYVRDTT